jgi:hypothetical protein
MTPEQRTALLHPCRLALETLHPRFITPWPARGVSALLTVNSGYE